MKKKSFLNLVPLKNDLVFKLVFTEDPKLLISLINSILFPDGKNEIIKIKIMNPEILSDEPQGKKSTLDIKAEDNNGRQFHVEVQVGYQNYYIKSSIFYLASIINKQLKRSELHYKIKPVYQINIIDFVLFSLDKYLYEFSFRDEDFHDLELTKDIKIVYLELPKFTKNISELKTKLDSWLYLFKNSEKLQEEEMTALIEKEPNMKNAFHILEAYSTDEKKRRRVEEKLRSDRDYQYDMAVQFEKGELKGEQKKAIETARLMKKEGDYIQKIIRVTGLTESDLKEHGII
jgi:predicted transposase/invertase (TIGR01784 family)